MNKITSALFVFLICAASGSMAQPVISGIAGAPVATITYGHTIPGAITAATAGANQTWDYSAVPYDTASYYFKTVDFAGLPQAIKDTFPTANTATEYYLGGVLTATLIYKLDASAFLYLGLNTTAFATPDTQLVFPHNFTETHAGFTYDAYGTLKTPFGTYTDVVRLRETIAGTHKYDFWQFSPKYRLLMEYIVDTATQAITVKAFYNSGAPTAIEDRTEAGQMAVYPNPAEEELFIQTTAAGNLKAQIYDALGRGIQSEHIMIQTPKPYRMNISHLNPGWYFVCLSDGKEKYSRKFLVR